MSGGGGSKNQTTRTEPWAAQQPFLRDTFNEARRLYDTGGPEAYTGNSRVGFDQATSNALDQTERRALSGTPITQNAKQLGANVLGNSPQFAGAANYLGQGPTLQNYANYAGAGGAPTLDQAQQPFTSQVTGLPDATQQALTQTAQGQSLNGNPYLDQQFDQAADRVTERFNKDINPAIAAQFSSAGRTGSNLQLEAQTRAAGEVSDSLGQLASNIYGNNYQQERSRQLQAAGQLGSLSQNQQGLGLQAAGQGTNFYNQQGQQDIARRQLGGSLFNQQQGNQLQAAGVDANVYGQQLGQQNTFAGLANSIANQDYTDLGQLRNVGATREGLRQSRLDDVINRHNFNQNQPQQNLQNYIASIQGNYGGSTTGPAQQQGPSRGQAAIAGGTAGATFGPWGAVIGAGLGYALGG